MGRQFGWSRYMQRAPQCPCHSQGKLAPLLAAFREDPEFLPFPTAACAKCLPSSTR